MPFTINTDAFPVGTANWGVVRAAIDYWNGNTPVRLVPKTGEGDFVEFRRADQVCESPVGRQGGCQPIECAVGNGFGVASVIHEVAHAIGLWHEQSRRDRDGFVRYMPQNVQDGKAHNFAKHVNDGEDVGPYDYASLMHYPPAGFARPGTQTLVPTMPIPAGVNLGGGIALSAGDLWTVNWLYSVWEPGNLLFYRDHRRDGTGEVANPTILGRRGWNQMHTVFSGGNGILYAVDHNGNLLFYRDHRRDGVGDLPQGRVIGRGGWDAFPFLFSGGNGDIYAVTENGHLLFYKDRTRDGTGDVANPGLIGQGGWQQFRSVFSGGDGILYAITQEGNLLFYRDQFRNMTGEVADAQVIGEGGWQQFRSVHCDGSGALYAITEGGDLLFYRDKHRNGAGGVADPRLIGRGGWSGFKFVIAGGDGTLYAVVP